MANTREIYRPSDATREFIADKTLIALIGATAVGKTEIIRRVIERGGPDFYAVGSHTTRERRPEDSLDCLTGDEGFTHEEARRLIDEGLSIVHGTHPTTGDMYVATAEHLSKYNIMPVLPSGLPDLEQVGFQAVHPLYIVTSSVAYQKQLASRINLDEETLKKRLKEGRESLSWALENAEKVSFFENIDGDPEQTANVIIANFDKTQSEEDRRKGEALAFRMRAHIQERLQS